MILEEKEVHLVKHVCRELGITYKKLGEEIGYSESSLRKAVSDKRTTLPLQKAIELYLKNRKLEAEQEKNKKMENMMKEFISHLFRNKEKDLSFIVDKT